MLCVILRSNVGNRCIRCAWRAHVQPSQVWAAVSGAEKSLVKRTQ